MKIFFLVHFLLLSIISFANNCNDSTFVSEPFSFETKDGLRLEGILTVPANCTDSTKVAVLVSPPIPVEKDYSGMYSSLAERLGKSGIATLRFSNRSLTDTALVAHEETVTMYNQAADVHDAVSALKKDKRFVLHPIGLIGHSEGGSAAIIEASRNNEIAFLVTLSTCGMSGADFSYWQTTLFLSYPNPVADSVRNTFVRDTYERIQIVKEENNRVAMEERLRSHIRQGASTNRNKLSDAQVEKGVKEWMKPRVVSFIKYEPETYLSQITCPVLACHGMMDGTLEWKTNLDGIEKAFIRSGKRNYKIMAFEGTDHGYQYAKTMLPFFISVSRKPGSKNIYVEKNWDRIAEWIRKI